MKRNHDEYRISEKDYQSFLRRSDGNSSGDHRNADDDYDPSIDADRQAEIDHLLASLDEDASAPVTTPPGADNQGHLTEDDEAVVAELDVKQGPPVVRYVEPAPPSKFDGFEKITEPEALKKLHERSRLFKGLQTRRVARHKASGEDWDKIANETKARYRAPAIQARADAKKARDVVRKREKRAGELTERLIEALERATANHGGDHFLVSIAGTERDLAVFREALSAAQDQHGPKVSLPKIAGIWSAMTGVTKSKQQADRKRDIVKKLEARGRPWHRLTRTN